MITNGSKSSLYSTRRRNGAGFTVTEVVITIGIFGMILAFPMLFWWGIGRGDALSSTTQEVVGVINEAHADTVSGKSPDGAQTSSYGIHFESTYYTYFAGTSYNQSASSNVRTDLPTGVSFSQIDLPENNVIFERITGEVLGFDAASSTVAIQDTNTGQIRIITISRFGGVKYE